MQREHVPSLGLRYWVALCVASIFGANAGDFYAHDVGLGHVAGLPFLAIAIAAVLLIERMEHIAHQAYYWTAIVIVRTAATNFADFFSVDLRLAKIWVMAALTIVLALALRLSWQFIWSAKADKAGSSAPLLRADLAYWFCMFIAGTLGTVIGDYTSHDWHLGDAWASIVLSTALLGLFAVGRRWLLWSIPFYWLTVVMIRAAGTVVGDFLASRNLMGLPLSTLVTGVVFVGLLLLWRQAPAKPAEQAA